MTDSDKTVFDPRPVATTPVNSPSSQESADRARVVVVDPHTLTSFLQRKLPTKEALIEGLLFKRDIISLVGRRLPADSPFVESYTDLSRTTAVDASYFRPDALLKRLTTRATVELQKSLGDFY